MGKAIINDIPVSDKNARTYYKRAYRILRLYYAACASGRYTDAQLMDAKLAMWKALGKYIDIAWQHHFAYKVSKVTGIGEWHGWASSRGFHQWFNAHKGRVYCGPASAFR